MTVAYLPVTECHDVCVASLKCLCDCLIIVSYLVSFCEMPPFIQVGRQNGEELLQAKADPFIFVFSGETALWKSASLGFPLLVRELFQAKADPFMFVFSGETALWKSASLGFPLLVRELLQAKADPFIPDFKKNRSPMEEAVVKQRVQVFPQVEDSWMNMMPLAAVFFAFILNPPRIAPSLSHIYVFRV